MTSQKSKNIDEIYVPLLHTVIFFDFQQVISRKREQPEGCYLVVWLYSCGLPNALVTAL